MYQVARSILFLHSGGAQGLIVYHRDIKSANIVLTHDYTAKLIDCGLSTFVPSDSVPNSESIDNCISSSTGVYGTIGYLCPEYARSMGTQPYKPAYDIFSLGVVLVEMICGQVQSRDADLYQMYVVDDGHLVEDADSTVKWQSYILDAFCDVALKCMSSKPTERPSSEELADQLGALATHCFCSMNKLSINKNESEANAADSGPPCM
jgi:serine/threonine protein kinase